MYRVSKQLLANKYTRRNDIETRTDQRTGARYDFKSFSSPGSPVKMKPLGLNSGGKVLCYLPLGTITRMYHDIINPQHDEIHKSHLAYVV